MVNIFVKGDIYHNERRILLRLYDYESFFYDFHVAMQHNDGGWTHKPGSTPSRCLSTDQNPEDDDLEWEIIKPDGFKYSYNSPFFYFAIS